MSVFPAFLFVGGMNSSLRWRQSKDQPASARVNGFELQNVPEKLPVPFRIIAIEKNVSAEYHEAVACAGSLIPGLLFFHESPIIRASIGK
jgi:hypothetical protein